MGLISRVSSRTYRKFMKKILKMTTASTTLDDIIFLGSASQYPSPRRALNSIVLRNSTGDNWLFDCGEGTQTRMMESNAKPGKLKKIFISHLHGDHIFGLPGLMCSIGQAWGNNEKQTENNPSKKLK